MFQIPSAPRQSISDEYKETQFTWAKYGDLNTDIFYY